MVSPRKIFLLFALLAGCAADKEPITFGLLYNLSGGQSALDVQSERGAALALAEVNKDGGVLDQAVIKADIKGNTVSNEVHVKTAALLEQHPQTVALIGLSDTDMARAAASAAMAADRVLLTSGATSPKLPEEFPGHLFLACYGDNVQAAAAAEWLYHDAGARRVLVIYDPEFEFTRLIKGYFTERFTELGGTVSNALAVVPASPEISTDNLKEIDAVYLALQTAQIALPAIKRLRLAGLSAPIVGADGFDINDVWATNPQISNVFFTTHGYFGADSPNKKARDFTERYEHVYEGERPTAFAGLGFDAVRLLAHALDNYGSADPAIVADALRQVRDFEGVTGAMDFTDSAVPRKSVTVMKVQNGAAHFLAERIPDSVSAP
ncbi:MAG: ABC transporter substrate-binding protein [Pseudomonadota bacterium]